MSFEQQLEALEQILFSAPFEDDALDIYGAYGALCAAVVSPEALPFNTILAILTGLEDEATYTPELCSITKALLKDVQQCLLNDELPELPEMEDDAEEDALRNWCVGFVEVVMACETDWLDDDSDEQIAESLIPILAISDLIDDPELQALGHNPKAMEAIAENLPNLVTDMYLYFHAGE